MPRTIRVALLTLRDLLVAAGPFVLIAVGLVAAAYWVLDPAPPKVVTLATGQEQGAYAEFGRRYARWMAQYGIEVRLRASEGTTENLALLRDPASGVDVAFVQGGADSLRPRPGEQKDDGLVALGGLFYEPVWVFYREDAAARKPGGALQHQLDELNRLSGLRVNIGAPGSGAMALATRLFEANGIDADSMELFRLAQTPAVVELLEGRIDAAVFVSAPEAPLVQMLLRTPGIRLLDFVRAEAYSRRYSFLAPVQLPRGVVDLAADLPPEDMRLIAPTAMLVAREDLHPALMQLFALAARAIHGDSGWFHRRGEFPSDRALEWPLPREAERALRNGTPWLQRYLPFWLANLVDRMWLVLLSMMAVLIPLSKVVPPLYQFRVRSRVFRWYGILRVIEDEFAAGVDPRTLLARVDELDDRLERVHVPLSYTDELYALRSHLALVRRKLRGRDAPPVPDDASRVH
jgi:TRAP-type uncharacterized transport system substrate-binding protein